MHTKEDQNPSSTLPDCSDAPQFLPLSDVQVKEYAEAAGRTSKLFKKLAAEAKALAKALGESSSDDEDSS